MLGIYKKSELGFNSPLNLAFPVPSQLVNNTTTWNHLTYGGHPKLFLELKMDSTWKAMLRSLHHALVDKLYLKPNETRNAALIRVKTKPTQCSFILITLRMPEKIKLPSYVINYRFGYLIQLIVHFQVDHHFGRLHLFLNDIIKHEKYKSIKKIKSSKVIQSKWYSSKSFTLSQTANCFTYRTT